MSNQPHTLKLNCYKTSLSFLLKPYQKPYAKELYKFRKEVPAPLFFKAPTP